MSLLDRLHSLIRRPGHEDEQDTFSYRCRDCDDEFESPSRHVIDATCPECGSEDIRVAENPYLDE